MELEMQLIRTVQGFPGGASGKEPSCQCRGHKRHKVNPWVPCRQPTRVVLPGKSLGQRSLVGYSPKGHKELYMTEQLTLSLSHSCFTKLYSFLLYKEVNQLDVYKYPLPLEPPSHPHPTPLLHHKAQSITELSSQCYTAASH